MKWIIAFVPVLLLSHWLAYVEDQATVRRHTVVMFGSPYYQGVFFGSCQTEVWFANERGTACATDTDKNGYPR